MFLNLRTMLKNPTILQLFVSEISDKLAPRSTLYVCGRTFPEPKSASKSAPKETETISSINLLTENYDFLQGIANVINSQLPKNRVFTIIPITNGLFALTIPSGSASAKLQSETEWFNFSVIIQNLKGAFLQIGNINNHQIAEFFGSSSKFENRLEIKRFLEKFGITQDFLQKKLDKAALFTILNEALERLLENDLDDKPAIEQKIKWISEILPRLVDKDNTTLYDAASQVALALKNLLSLITASSPIENCKAEVKEIQTLAEAVRNEDLTLLDEKTILPALAEVLEELSSENPEKRQEAKSKLNRIAALLPKTLTRKNHGNLLEAAEKFSKALLELIYTLKVEHGPSKNESALLQELAEAIKGKNVEAIHELAKEKMEDTDLMSETREIAEKIAPIIESTDKEITEENTSLPKNAKGTALAIKFTFFGKVGNKPKPSTYKADISFTLQGVSFTKEQMTQLKEGIKLWHEQHNISISLTYKDNKLEVEIPTNQELAESNIKDKALIEKEKQLATLQLMITFLKSLPNDGNILISGENLKLIALAKVIAEDLTQKIPKLKDKNIIVQGETPKPELMDEAKKVYEELKKNSEIKLENTRFDFNSKHWDNFAIDCDNTALTNYINSPAA